MLDRIFNVDNPVFRAINTIGKIFLLDMLWLVCSLPIFTIGASTTALIYACMKIKDDEGYVTANFFKSFKENFKQATVIFLLYLVVGIILGADFVLGNQIDNRSIGLALQIGAGILAIPYFLSLLYVFGVQARFVNSVKDTIRYAFFMSLRHMKDTLQMAILMILFLWVNTTVLLANFLSLIYGVGLMGFFFAAYYRHAFEKYLNPSEEKEESAGQ
ncbi:MAG: YesL family protein [Roseburia sp.]